MLNSDLLGVPAKAECWIQNFVSKSRHLDLKSENMLLGRCCRSKKVRQSQDRTTFLFPQHLSPLCSWLQLNGCFMHCSHLRFLSFLPVFRCISASWCFPCKPLWATGRLLIEEFFTISFSKNIVGFALFCLLMWAIICIVSVVMIEGLLCRARVHCVVLGSSPQCCTAVVSGRVLLATTTRALCLHKYRTQGEFFNVVYEFCCLD